MLCRVCKTRVHRERNEVACGICLLALPQTEREALATTIRELPRHEFLAVGVPRPPSHPEWERFEALVKLQASMANLPEPYDVPVYVRLNFVTDDEVALNRLTDAMLYLLTGVCFTDPRLIQQLRVERSPISDHQRVEVVVLKA